MDADAPNAPNPGGATVAGPDHPHQSSIPPPPPPGPGADGARWIPSEHTVANPFEYEIPPLQPGQLANGWRRLFVVGWMGVLVGFGCVWQAGRVAGIAPWWLGPETNPRFIGLIALPFVIAMIPIGVAVTHWKFAVHIGVAAGLALAAFALGDLHFPGLAIVEAIIGAAGVLISVASFGGRMRHPDRVEPQAG